MAKPQEMDLQEQLLRVLVLQLRRDIGNQGETIRELRRAGFGPSRIADLLGTSAGTVNQELVKAKKEKGSSRQRGAAS